MRDRRSRPRLVRASTAVAALLALPLLACGGAPSAPKTDEVFYLHGGGVIDKNKSWEVYFPKLDRNKTTQLPRFVGVGVLDGDVRFSRPIDWSLRDADSTPERRFIAYQSPRQFTFSILERVDPEGDPWPEVLRRYEQETRAEGAKILASRLPTATANGQGRAYVLRSSVKGKPTNFDAFSTEILVRSERRILLVQVVHRESIDTIADEVATAVSSLLVY
jgi:hypothetical protein